MSAVEVEVNDLAESFLRSKGVDNPGVVALFSTVAGLLAALPREKAVDGADEVLASINDLMAQKRATATQKDVPKFLPHKAMGAQAGLPEEAPAAHQPPFRAAPQ